MSTQSVHAATLSPGNITTCGTLASAGTYTLTQNIGIATTTGPCFIVTSNGVTINGAGFSATTTSGNTGYAVIATNSADGGNAYGTTTILNISFVNFSNGVNASGNNSSSISGGSGGSITISTSTMSGNVISNGGSGSSGGVGGIISINASTISGSIKSDGGSPLSVKSPFPNSAVSNGWIDMTGNVLLYHLNESSGTFTDSSGQGFTGTSEGVVTYGVAGALDKAISVNSSGVSYGANASALKPSSALSISVWVKGGSQNSSYPQMVSYSNSTDGYNLFFSGTRPAFIVNDGGWGSCYLLNGSINILDGNWHNLVGVYSGSLINIYIDGVNAGTSGCGNSGIDYGGASMGWIGRKGGYEYFNGSLDEVAIWSRPLSAAEVLNIYNTQYTGTVSGSGSAAGTISITGNSVVGSITTNGGTGTSMGSGGTVTVATSTTDSISAIGTGGTINIAGASLDFTGKSFTASSTLSLSYTGLLTTTNATTSVLSSLVVNGTNYGAFSGGTLPLFPGLINVCGTISYAGTYTLTQSISNIDGNCFNVQANNVTIDGSVNHYSVNANVGNTNYAVIAASTTVGAPAYGTTTIQNLTFTNFTNGVNANGSAGSSGAGGAGGTVIVSSTTIAMVSANGGNSDGGVGGAAGNVIIVGSSTIIGGSASVSTAKRIYLTSGASWSVPTDWNSASNTVEVIGGGGGGTYGVASNAGGGGGGGYSKVSNLVLTAGSSVSYRVGQGSLGSLNGDVVPAAGTDSYFCNSSSNCASISGSAVRVGAKGGSGGISTGSLGGQSSAGVGTVKYSGGNGGGTPGSWAAGGGGGAAGPRGKGGNGGSSTFGNRGGGGGGGNGGGANAASVSNSNGTSGGDNYLGAGGGTAGVSSSPYTGGAGTNGGGGGGSYGACNGMTPYMPGIGSTGIEWDSTHGSGGGGGGGGNACGNTGGWGANGGLYGAGGGGSLSSNSIITGNGANGIIVISYTSISSDPLSISASGGTGTSLGAGGVVTVATSTTASISAIGAGGTINISGINLNLSNSTYTASSSLILSYTGSLGVSNATTSVLASLVANGTNYGAYSGGAFPLIPGSISSCGKMPFVGVYTLSASISGISGTCFNVQANNVTIDGSNNHYTISATSSNSNYAVTAASTTAGASAYGTTTIRNITIANFANGVSANGSVGSGSVGGNGGNLVISSSSIQSILSSGGNGDTAFTGGRGGYIMITASSTVGSTTSQGGSGGNKSGSGTAGNGGDTGSISITNATSTGLLALIPGSAGVGSAGASSGSVGSGGIITISTSTTVNVTSAGTGGTINMLGTNLNLTNNIYSATSTLGLAYSGSLTTTNTTLSALAHFITNGTDLGSFVGGAFPLIPGTISSCGSLAFAGNYALGSSISGNCNVVIAGVILSGNGNTLTGNITSNNNGVTLSNIIVTGAVSTTGAGPGALIISSSTSVTGSVSVTGVISGDGTGSLASTTINAGGSISAGSVTLTGKVLNNGTINANNPAMGSMINNSIINTAGGTFTFNATSSNTGTVNGNAIFNAFSTNSGTVTGTAQFNMLTGSAGIVSFAGTDSFLGTGFVTGNIYDSNNSQITNWVFNASSTNSGSTKGDAVFNASSTNNVGATIVGNVILNNYSRNLGTITGDADVYSPVARPIGGVVSGQITYHNYTGLYFNDSAPGHGVTGKWNDVNNWWTDSLATVHSTFVPSGGDSVTITSGNISTTTSSAVVDSATFLATSSNSIYLTVTSTSTGAALFSASSTNSSLGTIVGNATFSGPDTTNDGTVTGYVTRQYTAGVFTVVSDFTHNGVHWIVQSVNGAIVNLAGATYSLATNAFQALNNGIFSAWNAIIGSGGSGVPVLSITSPAAGTITRWSPSISWGTNDTCQYKMDSGNYQAVVCSNNGSDIPKPVAGSHTIFLKSISNHSDPTDNISEKSVSFTYDNSQPISTDCSTPLDEAARPYYYLTANIVGNCSVSTSTTLRGDDGAGHYYSISGNITGSSTNNLSLQNVTATGLVSSLNNIVVSSSTLSGSIHVTGSLTSDTKTTLGSTTIESGATVTGGTFSNNLTNKSGGIIITSSITPVTVAGRIDNSGIIVGDIAFNGTSTNSGTVNGTVILNDQSLNSGTVNGNVSINYLSSNSGTVNGDLTYNNLVAVSGEISFSGSEIFRGTGHVSGLTKDNSGSTILRWVFNDFASSTGYIKGDTSFNDHSVNIGVTSANAYFNDSSKNQGTVNGNSYVYGLSAAPLGGTTLGSIVYYSYPNSISFSNISGDGLWSNVQNWFTDTSLDIPSGRIPSANEAVVLFASTTLTESVTNDLYIGMNGVIVDGTDNTLTGSISGNGAYGGSNGYNFGLENLVITGTSSASASLGGSIGGNGGNIAISTSTTAAIVSNGADGSTNGGNGGTLLIVNSYSSPLSSIVQSNGGNSTSCGKGGDAGSISLTDSSYSEPIANPGTGNNTGCPELPVYSSGRSGSVAVVGRYVPVIRSNSVAPSVPANPNRPYSGGSTLDSESLLRLFAPGLLRKVSVPFIIPSKLALGSLPKFGEGNGSFSFKNEIRAFLFDPAPENISRVLNSSPELKKFMAGVGLITAGDVVRLRTVPIVIPATSTVPGLYQVVVGTSTIPVSIANESVDTLVQRITVDVGQKMTINLVPLKDVKTVAYYQNNPIDFTSTKGKLAVTLSILAPSEPGRYYLVSSNAAFPLAIDVVKPVKPAEKKGFFLRVWSSLLNFIGI
ncbi:MAG: LamG domain-containing protein [Candidatus Taylorbacteria bacterium]